MTFDEALKEIEILKLQNKKMGETFDSLDKKYDSLKLELELAQACHKEKCAEFNKLCFDYAKLQVKNEKFEQNMKNVLEIEKKNAAKEFASKLKDKAVDFLYSATVDGHTSFDIHISELCHMIDELLKECLNDFSKS